VRGKGTKLGEGCPKVRLSQDRMPSEGAFRDFRICVYVRDYYEFWACYIRDCYVRENYIAPIKILL